MDLSEVINRSCSYSCLLVSLFLAPQMDYSPCATCRWVALLWLPYGHQALHIYCQLITVRWKPITPYSDPPPSSTFYPLLCYRLSVSLDLSSHFFTFSCRSLPASSFSTTLLSLSDFPCALITLYTCPAAKLNHVLLIMLYLCPSFFPIHMTATLSVNCFAVIPF